MAYLAFQEFGGIPATRVAAAEPVPDARHALLTPLEWTVIALARRDGLASLRPAGWVAKAFAWLVQRRRPTLADKRLEALRRMAVLIWAEGYAVPSYEVRAFLASGFTERQYEAMVDRVSASRALPPRTIGLVR